MAKFCTFLFLCATIVTYFIVMKDQIKIAQGNYGGETVKMIEILRYSKSVSVLEHKVKDAKIEIRLQELVDTFNEKVVNDDKCSMFKIDKLINNLNQKQYFNEIFSQLAYYLHDKKVDCNCGLHKDGATGTYKRKINACVARSEHHGIIDKANKLT